MDNLPQGGTPEIRQSGNRRRLLIVAVFVIGAAILASALFLINRQKRGLENYDINKPQVVEQNLNRLKVLTPEQREAIRKGFVERDWPNATTERKKYSAYAGLYSTFTAGWNVTKDPAVLAEMRKVVDFLAKQWPDFYAAGIEGGDFKEVR